MGFLVGLAARRAAENKHLSLGPWDQVLKMHYYEGLHCDPITGKQRRPAEEEELSDEFCRLMEKLTLRWLDESDREEDIKERRKAEASLQDHYAWVRAARSEAAWIGGAILNHCGVRNLNDNIKNDDFPLSEGGREKEESAPSIESPEVSVASPCPSPKRQAIDEIVTYSHDHHFEVPPNSPNAPEASKTYNYATECSEPDLDDRSAVRVSKLPMSPKANETCLEVPPNSPNAPEESKTYDCAVECSEPALGDLSAVSVSKLPLSPASPSEEECSHKSNGPSEPERHDLLDWMDSLERAKKLGVLRDQRQPVVAFVRAEPGKEKGKKNEDELGPSNQRTGNEAGSGRPAACIPTAYPNCATARPPQQPMSSSKPSSVPADGSSSSAPAASSSSEDDLYVNPFRDHSYSNICPHLTPFDCDPRNPCPLPESLPMPLFYVPKPNAILNPLVTAILAMRTEGERLPIPPQSSLASLNPTNWIRDVAQGYCEERPSSWSSSEERENRRLEEEARQEQLQEWARQEVQLEDALQQEIQTEEARQTEAQLALQEHLPVQKTAQQQKIQAEQACQQEDQPLQDLLREVAVLEASIRQRKLVGDEVQKQMEICQKLIADEQARQQEAKAQQARQPEIQAQQTLEQEAQQQPPGVTNGTVVQPPSEPVYFFSDKVEWPSPTKEFTKNKKGLRF